MDTTTEPVVYELPLKVAHSMAENFGHRAAPKIEAAGWVWNLGGPEGYPSADRVTDVAITLLLRISSRNPLIGYGKIEAGFAKVTNGANLWYIRLLGLDLVELRWQETVPGTDKFLWCPARPMFPKRRRP